MAAVDLTKIHKATLGSDYHCAVCGQMIRQVSGGLGPIWVHSYSGTVVAPNPPGVDLEALRERITQALRDSIDRCARCKVCDQQVDAAMAVIIKTLAGSYD